MRSTSTAAGLPPAAPPACAAPTARDALWCTPAGRHSGSAHLRPAHVALPVAPIIIIIIIIITLKHHHTQQRQQPPPAHSSWHSLRSTLLRRGVSLAQLVSVKKLTRKATMHSSRKIRRRGNRMQYLREAGGRKVGAAAGALVSGSCTDRGAEPAMQGTGASHAGHRGQPWGAAPCACRAVRVYLAAAAASISTGAAALTRSPSPGPQDHKPD
jgi:hypothetical protein